MEVNNTEKRLFYVTIEYSMDSPGVKKKIDEQVIAMERYFRTTIITNRSEKASLLNHFKLRKELKKLNGIIYIRNFGIKFILYFGVIKRISKRNIIILELPTPLAILEHEVNIFEKNIAKKQIRICLLRYIFPKLLKYTDFIVEIGQDSKRYIGNNKDKIITISNGIDTNKLPLKKVNNSVKLSRFISVGKIAYWHSYKSITRGINGIQIKSIPQKRIPINNKVIKFISVANISDWHGYDRLIMGMGEYYKNNPRVKVLYNCVGDGASVPYLKKLVDNLSLDEFVFFPGKKSGRELDELFDTSHIAFGSLANHRKGLDADSALKNREYCARGIPFVIASRDNGFPEDFKYSMKVSQDEKSINVNEVIKFYDSIKNSNYTTEMRKYAEENLTWDINLKPVFEKIKISAKFRHID